MIVRVYAVVLTSSQLDAFKLALMSLGPSGPNPESDRWLDGDEKHLGCVLTGITEVDCDRLTGARKRIALALAEKSISYLAVLIRSDDGRGGVKILQSNIDRTRDVGPYRTQGG